MQGEFKPSDKRGISGFFEVFADLHGVLYGPDEYEEPDIPAAGLLQDRMNIQEYFDAAVARLGLKD